MRTFRTAAFLIAAMTLVGTNMATGAEQVDVDCDDVVAAPVAEAFDAYCGRCHKAEDLAAKYFSGVTPEDAQQREADLALFLDRHSSCPHQHHEELAALLRELAAQK